MGQRDMCGGEAMMKRASIVLILLAIACSYCVGGYRTAVKYEARLARDALAAQAALVEAGKKALERERSLNSSLLAQSKRLESEQENANIATNKLHAAIRSGAMRLSIPTSAKSTCGAVAAVASEPEQTTRTELMPETANELISIAADGDAAVRQLNALIHYYNTHRDACNIDAKVAADE